MTVQIGLATPVVTAFPGTFAPWERTAGIEQISRLAQVADDLGYHHLTCSEHVAVPSAIVAERGGTYWDPLATLSFLAARTSWIRLFTKVLVLGYHHPVALAKRYGTLDRISAGRLMLGVGVGSLREEFELLGVPFEDRGARADDALPALRAALAGPTPSYRGDYVSFDGITVDPCAVQQQVPLLVGGRTLRSLRRAVTSADGWVPFALEPSEVRGMLDRVELPAGFEVVLTTKPLDPGRDRGSILDDLGELTAAGATVMSATIHSLSSAHFAEQLQALADLTGLGRAAP
jgi:probable F420-dependent oxidoreductase